MKQDHGFAFGVCEMHVFFKGPHDYVNQRRRHLIKLAPDLVLAQAFHKLLLRDAWEMLRVCDNAAVKRGEKSLDSV